MLPGPKALGVGRRTAAGMPGGVTLIQTPGGHVPAATQGSRGSRPPPRPAPGAPGPAPGVFEALQAISRHFATAAPHTRAERCIVAIVPRLTPGRAERFGW